MLNSDAKQSFKLATELDSYNKERQLLESNLLKNVLEKGIKNSNDPVLILDGNNWHEGIIGIVASRIKDKYNKPTIIISVKNNIGKASARSVLGFDIGSVIISAAQKGMLLKGGGHKMAGGFTIKEEKIPFFREFLIKNFEKSSALDSRDLNLYLEE